MAIASYADLQAAVARWLHRDDLTTQIPDFITLAEADLNRRLRTREMIGRDAAVLPANTPEYVNLPPDFNGLMSLTVLGRVVHLVEPETLAERTYFARSGQPEIVALVGNALRFYPDPNATYTLQMTYQRRLPSLSTIAPSNWLLATNPDAYLYATLLQSAPFIRDDERVALWAAAYEATLARIEQHDGDTSDSASRAPLRTDVPIGYRSRQGFGGFGYGA